MDRSSKKTKVYVIEMTNISFSNERKKGKPICDLPDLMTRLHSSCRSRYSRELTSRVSWLGANGKHEFVPNVVRETQLTEAALCWSTRDHFDGIA
jgi:hypothetical protein